jgi:hypothetical protein
MAALIAAALMERIMALCTYSVRALLLVCADMERAVCGVEAKAAMSCLLVHSIRYV